MFLGRYSKSLRFFSFKSILKSFLPGEADSLQKYKTEFNNYTKHLAFRHYSMAGSNLKDRITQQIASTPVLLYSKSTCPFCKRTKALLRASNVSFEAVEIDQIPEGADIQAILHEIYNQKTVPNIFIWGEHVGTSDKLFNMYSQGSLAKMLLKHSLPIVKVDDTFQYDLIVIGGGSGGLACAKEAGKKGARVIMLDFITPSPTHLKTTWGLGGTCVNVGCIPKKLMHRSAIVGHDLKETPLYGWQTPEKVGHDWGKLVEMIQEHIRSLNAQSEKDAGKSSVIYENALGTFEDAHTIKCQYFKDNTISDEKKITGKYIVVATGGRPKISNFPGAHEYCITSDDLFSLPYNPGKTVVVGASYVALECAGFLNGFGHDTTVLVRSILLRGFDQDMAEKIGEYMSKDCGIKMIRGAVPVKVEQIEDGRPRKLRVTYELKDSQDPNKITHKTIECNTVLLAIGRDPCTKTLGFAKAGVELAENGKIPAVYEQTNIPHIFALGDVLKDKLELTPVAIRAGVLLAQRLFAGSQVQCDYVNVPTTVFTPREYGAIGLSEEDAKLIYGAQNISVYHKQFVPLEEALPKAWQLKVNGKEYSFCYGKLITVRSDNDRVIGFHVLGPNAGEMTQGYAIAIRLGATKADFDSTIGIHPTCSETFMSFKVTKDSGVDITPGGC